MSELVEYFRKTQKGLYIFVRTVQVRPVNQCLESHSFHADPDPAKNLNADPDPDC
jgi:hypothetical protein